uniref:hypothetical protein n=1 Tax=Piscirickettsia salmonis TaxID=1238 RepID=UPI0039F6D0F8
MKAEAHGSAISRYMKYNTEGGSIQKFKFNFDDNKIYINHVSVATSVGILHIQ